jgi:hypothetical protein
LIITYYFYQAAGLYFIIVYAVVLFITIALFWRWSMIVRMVVTAASRQSIYWNAVHLSSLRVNPSYLLSLLRHCIMSIVQYCWQTSVVDNSIEAWKLFNFPYHLHGGVVPSSSSVLDERSQHGLQLLTANPPLFDLIPTEIKEMTKNILWSLEPVDKRLNNSSSNYIGELLQASSLSYDDDAIQVATGSTFNLAKQRASAFKRKNLTIDSAIDASRMILTNYQALLTTNEVTLVDPTEDMTMLAASDPSDCEVMVSMYDLNKLLREIWSSYHPLGKQLDIHQIDEVCESFRDWIIDLLMVVMMMMMVVMVMMMIIGWWEVVVVLSMVHRSDYQHHHYNYSFLLYHFYCLILYSHHAYLCLLLLLPHDYHRK